MYAYRGKEFTDLPAALLTSPLGSANAMPCVPGTFSSSAGEKTCNTCGQASYAPPTFADELTGEPNNGPGNTKCTGCNNHPPNQGLTGGEGKGINSGSCY